MILVLGWVAVLLLCGFIAVRSVWIQRQDDPSQRVTKQVEQWRRVRMESASGQESDSSNELPP